MTTPDIIHLIFLGIGTLASSAWFLVQCYVALYKIKRQEKASQPNSFLLIIGYVISVFCISSIATLVVQYESPPYCVLAPDNYHPFFLPLSAWIRWSIVIVISLIAIATSIFLFKKINN